MKRVLIIAAAMFFAGSVTVMALPQKETGKVQPQKATTMVKQETQKPAEVKTTSAMAKEVGKPVQKPHKKHAAIKAAPQTAKQAVKPAEPAKEVKTAPAPKK